MKKLIQAMPLVLLIGVLLFTNIIGVCLLVWGPISYWKTAYLFCGVYLPDLYHSDLCRIAFILFVPLLVLGIGYRVGIWLAGKLLQFFRKKGWHGCSSEKNRLTILFSILLFVYILIRLFSFLEIQDAAAWLNNNRYYTMRSVVMGRLSFWEFVLVYSILPTVVGMSYQKGNKVRQVFFLCELAMYTVVNIYVFQKRPLITGMILIGMIVFLNHLDSIEKWNLKRTVIVGIGVGLVLYIVYATGILLNTIEKNKSDTYLVTTEKISVEDMEEIAGSTKAVKTDDTEIEEAMCRTFTLEKAELHLSSFSFAQMMAAVGLLNRTAYATIVDVVFFPRYFSYYPLDLGLHMLGLGEAPDENIVAAKIMYPDADNPGATPVPFHVALYTQGGIVPAVAGAAVVGFCMGFFWILAIGGKHVLNYAFGAWICVFAVMIAMNSGPNALFSSDGAVWPVFLITMAYFCSLFLERKERSI